jgi:hypothetical protein
MAVTFRIWLSFFLNDLNENLDVQYPHLARYLRSNQTEYPLAGVPPRPLCVLIT